MRVSDWNDVDPPIAGCRKDGEVAGIRRDDLVAMVGQGNQSCVDRVCRCRSPGRCCCPNGGRRSEIPGAHRRRPHDVSDGFARNDSEPTGWVTTLSRCSAGT